MNDIFFPLAQHAEAVPPLLMGLPILLGAAAYLLAVASPFRRRNFAVALLLVAGLAFGWWLWWNTDQPAVEVILFTAFAAMMVGAGFGMAVESNPVYVALWFATVILSTCGLFLMLGAAFISAATVIVYAGAIIVTFLFVIMLARQTGSAIYDRRFRRPVLAMVTGAVLLTALVIAFRQPMPAGTARLAPETLKPPDALDRNTLSTLGRSLFADHLWSVELAGVLLLIATFGTILIALQTRETPHDTAA